MKDQRESILKASVSMIIIVFVIALLSVLTGCRSGKTYYENGNVKSEYDGSIDWSTGKSLNFSVIGK